MKQAELNFGSTSWADGMSEDAKALCSYLKGRGTVKGKQIQQDLGWDEKHLRDVRAQAKGAILSGPGFPGYCLMVEARVEDYDRIIATRRAMLKQMDMETTAMIRFYHRHAQP